nr:MAG TPA: hypothetical protein [Caudoviricetes sp.]
MPCIFSFSFKLKKDMRQIKYNLINRISIRLHFNINI